uniref:Zinc finger CCHC domain-containing protein 7 n=1 Tax=Steinernema glaseri TaxID=37863 RepID=A0A1I7ZA69_9BILA
MARSWRKNVEDSDILVFYMHGYLANESFVHNNDGSLSKERAKRTFFKIVRYKERILPNLMAKVNPLFIKNLVIEESNRFYGVVMDTDDLEEDIRATVLRQQSKCKQTFNPGLAQAVLVKTRRGELMRGLVWNMLDTHVEVYLVDTGETIRVAIGETFLVPKKNPILQLPPMAIRFAIDGHPDDYPLSDEECRNLQNYIKDKHLCIKLRGTLDGDVGGFKVSMHATQNGHTEDIQQMLFRREFAKDSSSKAVVPASIASPAPRPIASVAPREVPVSVPSRYSPDRKPMSEVTCFYCGQRGHYLLNCPRKREEMIEQAKNIDALPRYAVFHSEEERRKFEREYRRKHNLPYDASVPSPLVNATRKNRDHNRSRRVSSCSDKPGPSHENRNESRCSELSQGSQKAPVVVGAVNFITVGHSAEVKEEEYFEKVQAHSNESPSPVEPSEDQQLPGEGTNLPDKESREAGGSGEKEEDTRDDGTPQPSCIQGDATTETPNTEEKVKEIVEEKPGSEAEAFDEKLPDLVEVSPAVDETKDEASVAAEELKENVPPGVSVDEDLAAMLAEYENASNEKSAMEASACFFTRELDTGESQVSKEEYYGAVSEEGDVDVQGTRCLARELDLEASPIRETVKVASEGQESPASESKTDGSEIAPSVQNLLSVFKSIPQPNVVPVLEEQSTEASLAIAKNAQEAEAATVMADPVTSSLALSVQEPTNREEELEETPIEEKSTEASSSIAKDAEEDKAKVVVADPVTVTLDLTVQEPTSRDEEPEEGPIEEKSTEASLSIGKDVQEDKAATVMADPVTSSLALTVQEPTGGDEELQQAPIEEKSTEASLSIAKDVQEDKATVIVADPVTVTQAFTVQEPAGGDEEPEEGPIEEKQELEEVPVMAAVVNVEASEQQDGSASEESELQEEEEEMINIEATVEKTDIPEEEGAEMETKESVDVVEEIPEKHRNREYKPASEHFDPTTYKMVHADVTEDRKQDVLPAFQGPIAEEPEEQKVDPEEDDWFDHTPADVAESPQPNDEVVPRGNCFQQPRPSPPLNRPASSKDSYFTAPSPRACWYCHEEGHFRGSCPKLQCFRCRKFGHLAKFCTEVIRQRLEGVGFKNVHVYMDEDDVDEDRMSEDSSSEDDDPTFRASSSHLLTRPRSK